jgi:hypothetical protein
VALDGRHMCRPSQTCLHACRVGSAPVPPQNPITRIEQVARDLGRLAEEIETYAGGDARRTLLYWSHQLRSALDELESAGHRDSGGSAA